MGTIPIWVGYEHTFISIGSTYIGGGTDMHLYSLEYPRFIPTH
jgi:hypothetical protein